MKYSPAAEGAGLASTSEDSVPPILGWAMAHRRVVVCKKLAPMTTAVTTAAAANPYRRVSAWSWPESTAAR